MADRRLDRRQVVTGAGALGLRAALGTPEAARADEQSAHGITGSSLTRAVSATGAFPPSDVLFGFATGGVLIETGSTDQQAGARSSPGIGTWSAQGPDGFHAKLLGFLLADNGDPQAIFTAVFVGQLESKGEALSATYTLRARDFQGNLIATDHGTAQGTRIEV